MPESSCSASKRSSKCLPVEGLYLLKRNRDLQVDIHIRDTQNWGNEFKDTYNLLYWAYTDFDYVTVNEEDFLDDEEEEEDEDLDE